MMSPLARLALAWISLVSAAGAQTLAGTIPGAAGLGGYYSMGPAFDVNGDGYDDVYVGTRVYSGLDLSLIREFDPDDHGICNPSSMTVVRDWNGDGISDAVHGNDPWGPASCALEPTGYWVVSGADGSLILFDWIAFSGPVFAYPTREVFNAGDVDGDGLNDLLTLGYDSFDDFVAGAYQPSSTVDDELYISGFGAFGDWDPAGVGDVLGDGRGYWAHASTGSSARIEIHDEDLTPFSPVATIDLGQSLSFQNPTYVPGLGLALANFDLGTPGDLDGDGTQDVFVSVRENPFAPPEPFARVYASADFQTILFELEAFGQLAAVGDVDADGVPDLLLGDSDGLETTARLYSGATQALLWQETVPAGSDHNRVIATAGDLNGDGITDWLLGAGPEIRVYHGEIVGSNLVYCDPKATSTGCLPAIGWNGTAGPTGPDDFAVVCRDVPPGKNGLFFFGTSGAAALPWLGGTLCVQPPLTRNLPITSIGAPPCDGGYVQPFTQAQMAAEGLTPGDQVHGQWWMRDPQNPDGTGVALSDGIQITIGS